MMIEIAPRLQQTEEYYFSRKMREIADLRAAGVPVINLGIGSPDLQPHPSVVEALATESALPQNHGYQSYKGSDILREAIVSWYKSNYNVNLSAREEVLPLIGSKEGIMHVCMTYLSETSLALFPNPGYPTYNAAASISGAATIPYDLVEESNWQPDFSLVQEQVETHRNNFPGANVLMFLNYPQMPTGVRGSKELFATFIDFARMHNILLVHDNPYSFILTKEPLSIFSVAGAMDVAIELNSLSKSHNMAGWRVGMVCGRKEHIDNILRFKSNMDSGMFLPVQLAAAKALSLGPEWNASLNEVYAKRKSLIQEFFKAINCEFDENQEGLFVWARVPDKYKDAYEASDDLLATANVFITPGGIFGSMGNSFLRASLCANEEIITECINRIKAVKI